MRRIGITVTLFGALLWGSVGAAAAAAPTSAKGKSSIARATALLAGKRFTHFTDTGSVAVPSSYDERLHLCPGGRFVYDEMSNLEGVGTRVARTVGRWQVLSARFERGRAVVRVRGEAKNRALVVTIASNGRRTLVGGRAVAVGRSDLCRS